MPNTSATAASSGADLNGKAVQNACIKIRERLAKLAAEISQSEADQVQFEDSMVSTANGHSWTFPDLVQRAYMARVQLWDSGFIKRQKFTMIRSTIWGVHFLLCLWCSGQ